MKLPVLTGLLILAASANSYSQDAVVPQNGRAKGFIGFTVGPSIPVGRFAKADKFRIGARPGSHLNLVNFGYRISGNIGIALKWYGGANPVKFPEPYESGEEAYEPWSYGGILIGPLVSVPVTQKLELDFRPMIGINSTTLPGTKGSSNRELDSGKGAISLGVTLQYRVARRLGLHFGVDYLRTSATFEHNQNKVYNIRTLTPSVGLVFRLGLEKAENANKP